MNSTWFDSMWLWNIMNQTEMRLKYIPNFFTFLVSDWFLFQCLSHRIRFKIQDSRFKSIYCPLKNCQVHHWSLKIEINMIY